MEEMTEVPFEFDSKLGVIQLNRTTLDKSKAPDYTWENGGIYREFSYHLVDKYGRTTFPSANSTPRIESFLRSRSFAPTFRQYWMWKIRRAYLICKRAEEVSKWMT